MFLGGCDPGEDRILGEIRERVAAQERFIHHHPERVDVRAAVQRFMAELLRRGVAQGPEHGTDPGHIDFAEVLGDPEVHDDDPLRAVLDHDVGRFDVPVNDRRVVVVRKIERAGHLFGDGEDLRNTQGPGLAEVVAQGLSLDVLHHEVVELQFLVPLDIDHPHDVGVVQAGQDPGLAVEALDQVRVVPEVGGHHLQGRDVFERGVADLVHHTHAALPELAQHLVLLRDDHGFEMIMACPGQRLTRRVSSPARAVPGAPAQGIGYL